MVHTRRNRACGIEKVHNGIALVRICKKKAQLKYLGKTQYCTTKGTDMSECVQVTTVKMVISHKDQVPLDLIF